MLKLIIGLIALCALASATAQILPSQYDVQIILAKRLYTLSGSHVYSTITDQYQLLTKEGINDNKQYQIAFFPDSEKIDWIQATITQPSGAKVVVPNENIHSQPIFANSSAASLSNEQVMTISFPQLMKGSTVSVTYHKISYKPNLDFNLVDQPNFNYPNQKRRIIVNFPKFYPLTFSQRGGYTIKRSETKKSVRVVATLLDQPRHYVQTNMVDYQDSLPLFSASNFQSWQQIGNYFWRSAKDKIIVNEQIKELAQQIVGDKKGLAAAEAIYNWTINNIYFIAVRLNESDSLVPQSSVETLNKRYGDCKAIVILLEALYKAVGINSQPALIAWNNSYKPLPTANLQQFNHAILYLPDYKLFINSTDRYAPFAVLENGLQNKLVVIAGKQSIVTHTPLGNPQENTYRANQFITVQADGSLIGKSHMDARGTIAIDMRSQLAYALRQTKLQELANQTLQSSIYGGFGELFISDLENLNQLFTVTAIWRSPEAINMGERLFLLPPKGLQFTSIDNLRSLIFEKGIRYPIIVTPASYHWCDVILVPTNYHFQSLPHAITIHNTAGDYMSQYQTLSSSKIKITRQLVLKRNYYNPEDYNDLKIIASQAARDANNILYLRKPFS